MTCQAVIITGLRRSGTTILWETLRRDPLLLCFDEPFHPRLWEGERQNAKGTWDELGSFWDRERPDRNVALKPILPADELVATSTPAQVAYLSRLLTAGDRVVIDVVRTWNRWPSLLDGRVRVHVVHLVRDPVSWVTAHLLPSGDSTWRKRIGDCYRRATVFHRQRFYDNWQYEQIIDAALATRHPLWSAAGIAPERLDGAPAYEKLTAFWWAANLTTHRRLADWNGGSFTTVTLRDFTADPARIVSAIARASDWETPNVPNFEQIRPIRAGWQADSPRWARAFANLTIPEALASKSPLSGVEMNALFEAHTSGRAESKEVIVQ